MKPQEKMLHRVIENMKKFKDSKANIHAEEMRGSLQNLVMVYHTDHSPLKSSEYNEYINKNWK